MPVNEFEKQVQKLMEELKVAPSENVWSKVEQRIREKKRRRWLIIFPLLIGLVLLGYLANPYLFPKTKTNIAQENKKDNQPVSNIQAKQDLSTRQKPSQSQLKNEMHSAESIMKNKYGSFSNEPGPPQPKRHQSQNIIINEVEKLRDQQTNKIAEVPTDKTTEPDISLNEKKTDVASSNLNNQDSNQNSSIKKNVTATVNAVASLGNSDSINRKEVVQPDKTKKKSSAKKLSWGIQFSSGVSSINDKLFSLAKSQATADAYYASPVTGPVVVNTPPSKSKSGFAFQVGSVAGKRISKRSSLSVGLLYSYYSNHIKVGARRDSVIRLQNSLLFAQNVSGYYQGIPQNDFTNKYHFIELPVQYSIQLNKGKMPVTWDVAVMFGRMIASNGLTYDTARRGIYYDNNKLLNKNNVGISSGFSFGINLKNEKRLFIGPHVRFSLTDFYKNEYENNKYLLYGGLKINLLFPNK